MATNLAIAVAGNRADLADRHRAVPAGASADRLLAGAAGVWLFYVQHQFEETHWSKVPEWQFQHAALNGSSHYDLPGVLRWLTGNIGIHHVHHLSSRVPYYRLPEVLRDFPELKAVGRITILESLRCVKLVLWDEGRRRLISFREERSLA